ncbi:MAG: hypothetical protein ACE5JD_15760 [Candidatus Methylomirabilia bacterium]
MNSTQRLTRAGLALVLVAAVSTAAWAQLGLTRREGFFTITWNVDRSTPGQIAIIGEVHNGHELTASDVRLRVTGADARGRVVSQSVGSVDDDIPPYGQSFFEIRLTPVGIEASFHVSVAGFEYTEKEMEAP